MRVFLTGGTGYIGSAVLDALVRAGHHVDALVRNREKAAAGAGARRPPGARRPLAARDLRGRGGGGRWRDSRRARRFVPRACARRLGARHAARRLHAPSRFFIYTSGVWVLGPAPTPVDETAAVNPVEQSAWRVPHEQRVLAAAGAEPAHGRRPPGHRLRRLPRDCRRPVQVGRERPGPGHWHGENHWPLVYDRDLGELYLLLATNPTASGVFHANDECDERVNDLVAAIAGHVSIVRASARCR